MGIKCKSAFTMTNTNKIKNLYDFKKLKKAILDYSEVDSAVICYSFLKTCTGLDDKETDDNFNTFFYDKIDKTLIGRKKRNDEIGLNKPLIMMQWAFHLRSSSNKIDNNKCLKLSKCITFALDNKFTVEHFRNCLYSFGYTHFYQNILDKNMCRKNIPNKKIKELEALPNKNKSEFLNKRLQNPEIVILVGIQKNYTINLKLKLKDINLIKKVVYSALKQK